VNIPHYKKFQQAFLDLTDESAELARVMAFSGLVQICRSLSSRVREEKFFLSVLGEIKRGKSTLINAILGSEILPKSALVCTASLCVLRYGETPKAAIFWRDKTISQVDQSDLKQFVTKKNPQVLNIEHVEIDLPIPILKDGIVIIDTPGVNDTDELRRRLTEEFVPRSDGVIFVLNAGQPLSDSEMRFLTSSVLKYHIKKLWFVVNGIDRLENESQKKEALDYCRENLEPLLPGVRVCGVSAKLALEAVKTHNSEMSASSGLPQFLESLSADLIEERREHLFDVPIGILESVLENLEKGVEWSKSLIDSDADKIEKTAHHLIEECRDILAEKDRLLERFVAEVENIVFEEAKQSTSISKEGVSQAVLKILAMDDADERKCNELSLVLNERIQSFRDQLLDSIHRKICLSADNIIRRMIESATRLDSRASLKTSSGRFDKPQYHFHASEELGVKERTLVSGFGRWASVAFLLQGNLLFAAASLAASFASRLTTFSATSIIPRFNECLDHSAGKILTSIIAEKHNISGEYLKILENKLDEILVLIHEIRNNSADAMKNKLESALTKENMLDKCHDKIQSLKLRLIDLEKGISG